MVLAQVESQPPQPNISVPIPPIFKSPMFIGMGIFIGILLILKAIQGGGVKPAKVVATTGRWAGNRELNRARKKVLSQIKAQKYDEVGLHIGNLATKFLPFANSNPANLIIGRPGTGKSTSGFEPLYRSAVDQGFPMVIYDPAGDHTKNLSGYAASRGYKIYHFCPGSPHSDTLNLLDFLEDDADSEMAETLATTLSESLNRNGGKFDAFFGPAAVKLVKAAALIAKGSAYSDILMAFKILCLSDLALRVSAFDNVWVRSAASTTVSTKDSSKTVGGIVGSAQNPIESLITERNLSVTLGKSSIPLDVKGKTIVFLTYDEQVDKATAPIIATAIELFIKRNVGNHIPESERTPLILGLDEFSSGDYFSLPSLSNWTARFRKFGLVCICGCHNYSQLRVAYGQDRAKTLIESFGNKLFFNPNGDTAADLMAELGEQDVVTKNVSIDSQGRRNTSYDRRTMPLMTKDQIAKMPPRAAIYISQAVEGKYKGENQSSIPYKIRRITIPKADLEIQDKSKRWWQEKGQSFFITRAQSRFVWSRPRIEMAISEREHASAKILPVPEEPETEQQISSLLKVIAK